MAPTRGHFSSLAVRPLTARGRHVGHDNATGGDFLGTSLPRFRIILEAVIMTPNQSLTRRGNNSATDLQNV